MKRPIIHSKYNSKEKFTFEKTPSEFESVTKKSIDGIKAYCTRTISSKYKNQYDSRTLYAMIGTVIGNFDLLTSQLKEDYGNRRSKLKRAQSLGIRDVNEKIFAFKKTVDDYERALSRLESNLQDFDGTTSTKNLHFQSERLTDFDQRLKKIEEKNHEA